jgi:hypothetical protein
MANGQIASGVYEMQFYLRDALTGGNPIGGTNTIAPVAVSNGLFTVAVDFGSNVFTGGNLWLEIGVRPSGSLFAFTTLTPRQALQSVPYAVFASGAATAGTATNLAPGGVISGNGAGLTNLNGAAINPGTIFSNQIDPATWQMVSRGVVNRVFNVKDFGATGNGVADDTVALANAWNAFLASGGTLYFPPGTYLDSGTHSLSTGVSSTSTHTHSILGAGSVVWRYTGVSRMLNFYGAAPDLEGIQFQGNDTAMNCIYASELLNKWSVKSCLFNYWPNATVGAVVLDEADSVSITSTYFYQCKIGLGLGYNCPNFKGDLEVDQCGTGIAVGVPTDRHLILRSSECVSLDVLSRYCGCTLAVDAGSSEITLRGFNWYATNGVVLNAIPGVSTNYGLVYSVTLDKCAFFAASGINSPIQLYDRLGYELNVHQCAFQTTASSPALIKSLVGSADACPVEWQGSYQIGSIGPVFESSSGLQLSQNSLLQSQSLNRSLGLYNQGNLQNLGGSGNVLDVLDASRQGPIARVGVSEGVPSAFRQFMGGLVVQYDPVSGRAVVQVTNADLVVSGGRIQTTNVIVSAADTNLYSIVAYGAVGGDVARDSAGLAAAFQAATNNGGTLYVPAGVYLVTNNLVLLTDPALTTPWASYAVYAKMRIRGAGSATSVLKFVGANSTLIESGFPLEISDLGIQNGGTGTNAGIKTDRGPQGNTGPSSLINVTITDFDVGADLLGGAGGYLYGCAFKGNRIGLRLPGFCDGWTVDSRVDQNIVGIEVGGPTGVPEYGGTRHANGARIHLTGSHNSYAIVVGGSEGTDISGYLESCTNAFFAIGHPPALYGDQTDPFVGSVHIHNFSSLMQPPAGSAPGTFFDGVQVFAPPEVLHMSDCRLDPVQIMTNTADASSYVFEKVAACYLIDSSGNPIYLNSNPATMDGAGSLIVNPDPVKAWYAGNSAPGPLKSAGGFAALGGTFTGDGLGLTGISGSNVNMSFGAGLSAVTNGSKVTVSIPPNSLSITTNLEMPALDGGINQLQFTKGVLTRIIHFSPATRAPQPLVRETAP